MKTSRVTIVLRERYGEEIMSRTDGEALGETLARELREGRDVELDFAGTRAVLSAFLNPAVGDLYAEFPGDDVDVRVRAVNESKSQRDAFERVKRQGRRFYNDEAYRKGVRATRDALFD